jgi:hypothetical protein
MSRLWNCTLGALAVCSIVLAAACTGGNTMSSPTAPTVAQASTAPPPAPGDERIAGPRPAEEPPPPPTEEGGQGCTPGYWKQAHHYDSYPAPYTSATLFNDVFDDVPEYAGLTLSQVAALEGGGLNALARHTVAALLNAASGDVSYDLTASDVINAFNSVYPDGDYETLKNIFERLNQQGCPLS